MLEKKNIGDISKRGPEQAFQILIGYFQFEFLRSGRSGRNAGETRDSSLKRERFAVSAAAAAVLTTAPPCRPPADHEWHEMVRE